ncbi:MAG TPA: shikimate dehydrogenase [Stellaceae bacterium]|nr:shikimate dehydrogenase [Stellaceae bacterium]
MKRAGVMGWPVAQSRSPVLHRFWLEHYGIEGDYTLLPVPPEALERELRALAGRGFAGCNLTLPHKEPSLALLDRVDATARRIGAVNTVVAAADGALEGSNTDAFGFHASLAAALPGWSAASGPAVVLGAGGSARAVVAALLDHGAPEIRLVNRGSARAEALAAALGGRIDILAWESRADALAGAALLVNTTSLGMAGQPPLDLALDALPEGAVVSDIVYVPLRTGLLAAAQARGNPTVDGLGMLLYQAQPGFAAWFGLWPEVSPALRARVLASLAAP